MGEMYRGVEQLVARRAHNPKVAGSSPATATKTGKGRPCVGPFFDVFFQNGCVYRPPLKIGLFLGV